MKPFHFKIKEVACLYKALELFDDHYGKLLIYNHDGKSNLPKLAKTLDMVMYIQEKLLNNDPDVDIQDKLIKAVDDVDNVKGD